MLVCPGVRLTGLGRPVKRRDAQSSGAKPREAGPKGTSSGGRSQPSCQERFDRPYQKPSMTLRLASEPPRSPIAAPRAT